LSDFTILAKKFEDFIKTLFCELGSNHDF